jgi:hypothetical protein
MQVFPDEANTGDAQPTIFTRWLTDLSPIDHHPGVRKQQIVRYVLAHDRSDRGRQQERLSHDMAHRDVEVGVQQPGQF